jgi:hypothetical protein
MASGPADRAIYVIATTPDGTERALHEARRRAHAAAQIVLIVPAIVPEGRATADTANLVTEFGALAARSGVRPPYVCVCRQPREVLAGFPLDGSALIIIGGPTGGRSRPSPERDLARHLVGDGYDVLFANVSRPEPVDEPIAGLSPEEG